MTNSLSIGTEVKISLCCIDDLQEYFGRQGGDYTGVVVEVDPDQENPGYYDHLVEFKSGAKLWFCRFDLTPVEPVV